MLERRVKQGTICSVDRGTLADRVANLPRVHYIRGLMEDCQAAIEPFGPFGIITSDASLLWNELLDQISTAVVNKATVKQSKDDSTDNGNIEPAVKRKKDEHPVAKFTLPCIFVLTMKLPHQTPQSIQRHIQWLQERLPRYLSTMTAAMYPDIGCSTSNTPLVQTRYIIVHLMANSSSERTLIAIFEPVPVTKT